MAARHSPAASRRKVKMRGDAILIETSFVFRFIFCDRNHIPRAHAYYPHHDRGSAGLTQTHSVTHDGLTPLARRLKPRALPARPHTQLGGRAYQWISAGTAPSALRGESAGETGSLGRSDFRVSSGIPCRPNHRSRSRPCGQSARPGSGRRCWRRRPGSGLFRP